MSARAGSAGQLGLKDEWGIKLGGLWLADTNLVVAGGAVPGGWTNNQAFFLGLAIDADKLVGWRGASFGFQFLQFNGADTNEQAGSIAGYNSIVGLPPHNRYGTAARPTTGKKWLRTSFRCASDG